MPFSSKLASLLAKFADYRHLVIGGELQLLADRSTSLEDCFDNLTCADSSLNSSRPELARELALQIWHADADKGPDRIVTCVWVEPLASDGQTRIQFAAHSQRGTVIAETESLSIWNKQSSWEMVGFAILNMVQSMFDGQKKVWSNISPTCRLTYQSATCPENWQTQLRTNQLVNTSNTSLDEAAPFILSGSFNPFHDGHRAMAEYARQTYHQSVDYELSITNSDKPPIDYMEIKVRTHQEFAPGHLWLTQAPTFERKAKLFPNRTFLVGADTIKRIGDARFYGNDLKLRDKSISYIKDRDCRFLVFGRLAEGEFESLEKVDLPKVLLGLCEEVTEEQFRVDVSSTEIRSSVQ